MQLSVSYGKFKRIQLTEHPHLFILWRIDKELGGTLEVVVYQMKGDELDLSSHQVYSSTDDHDIINPRLIGQVRPAVLKLIEGTIGGI